jgi:phage repressor protein C with HTH and peptisase S24 domain
MEAGGIDGGGGGLANGTVEEIVEQIIAGSHGLPDDDDQRTRFERLQMQRIRELDMEQLEVEDIDYDSTSILSDDESSMAGRGDGGGGAHGGFTFDTNLASMHTYLGGLFWSKQWY